MWRRRRALGRRLALRAARVGSLRDRGAPITTRAADPERRLAKPLRSSHISRATGPARRPTVAGVADDPRRRLGARGEELAARHLEARGLEVVERNYRTRYGELDVVARDERFLVFCEVKTRIVRGDGDDVLGPFAAIG